MKPVMPYIEWIVGRQYRDILKLPLISIQVADKAYFRVDNPDVIIYGPKIFMSLIENPMIFFSKTSFNAYWMAMGK